MAKSIEQLPRDIDKLIDQLLGDLETSISIAAERMRASAVERCPVDTGNLRGSITANKIGKFKWRVGTMVEYASYVELGTSRQRAQPYLRPAAEDAKKWFLKDLDIRINKLFSSKA